MLVVPYIYVLRGEPRRLRGLMAYGGQEGRRRVRPHLFGAAVMAVGVALITQMGEQADYLRFMPERTPRAAAVARRGAHRRTWLGGARGAQDARRALLAWLAIQQLGAGGSARSIPTRCIWSRGSTCSEPRLGDRRHGAVRGVSQLKINVTNAYAGSLAWSELFARLTHSHPGRVVWVVFNTLIALMLMELDVFQALGKVLGLYSNIAISWMMAVVADLVINKPLGLSPPGIEFKRAHLYDINPVGVGQWASPGAFGGGLFWCLRRGGAVVLGADRAAHRLRGLAVDRLGDPRATTSRVSPEPGRGCSAA